MLVDLSIVCGLMVIAQLLRTSVRWIGLLMIPTSIIAGVLGLAGGPEVLNILPFSVIDQGDEQILQLSQYPGQLIVLVFATLLMGHKVAQENLSRRLQQVKEMLCYSLAAELGQYGVALLVGVFLLPILFPGLPSQFAVMLSAGFAGGHGTAAIFGQAFVNDSWLDALSVGFAFATIGLAVSIVGGMVLINIALYFGWNSYGVDATSSIEDQARSFLPEHKQQSLGRATVNPIALDPLGWHVALVLSVYGLTLALDSLVHVFVPGEYWIPQFALAMLIGAAVQFSLNRLSLGQYVDRSTMQRLGSLCADLLVACGVASIKPDVVLNYSGPILVMSIVGIVYSVGFLFLAPYVFGRQWFEKAIFTYGWLTGVVGFGVALLRVVDPRFRSHTLEEYGTSYLLIGPTEIVVYPLIIWACITGFSFPVGLLLSVFSLVLVVATRVANSNLADVAMTPAGIEATRDK